MPVAFPSSELPGYYHSSASRTDRVSCKRTLDRSYLRVALKGVYCVAYEIARETNVAGCYSFLVIQFQ
jgi:hypothetical protein